VGTEQDTARGRKERSDAARRSGATNVTARSRTDEELMAAYAGGDAAAFGELFARFSPLLMGVMRSGMDEEAARDLVQQTFLQLHRARRDYRPDQPLRPWLLTIAYNLKRDHWRRRGRRPEVPLNGAPEQVNGRTPAQALERERRSQKLRAALVQLADDQRQVIELHWFGGLGFAEIAETVGASVSAVKVRAHRGYKRLRGLLEEAGSL
jgi:RNA polymerase sigma-70 factor (ECF subfamily)